jgi:hypothetical protein
VRPGRGVGILRTTAARPTGPRSRNFVGDVGFGVVIDSTGDLEEVAQPELLVSRIGEDLA